MNSNREKILSNIREALRTSSNLPDMPEDIDEKLVEKLKAVTPPDLEGRREQFRQELELVSGEYYWVNSTKEVALIISDILQENRYEELAVTDESLCQEIAEVIVNQLKEVRIVRPSEMGYPERKNRLAQVDAALVKAAFAVADIGSLVFPYDNTGTSLPHFLSDCIFVIVEEKDLVSNQFELFEKISPEKAKNMVFMTGPSRTADIEKVLVLGAHGPRRLIVFMYQSS